MSEEMMHVCKQDNTLRRIEKLMQDHGSRLGSLEGRMLVVESVSEMWKDSKATTDELRLEVVKLESATNTLDNTINNGLTKSIKAEVSSAMSPLLVFMGASKTQARITWVLLLLILSALVGIAFKVIQAGGLP